MGEHRTIEQIREHYEIEKGLASRLRNACEQERRKLYSSLYNELYRRVPLHPQLTRKTTTSESKQAVSSQLKILRPFLSSNTTFLEVGPGDCALAFEVAKSVKKVYAVDVSDEITKASAIPHNFQLALSDGCSIPVPPDSVDVAYSNQLMEHLHPDDALEQLEQIYSALTPGGIYFCITPNRLYGPSDVSAYFDETASGFHLKEYTTRELTKLFRNAGFSRVKAHIGVREIYIHTPVFPIAVFEMSLDRLPNPIRKTIARNRISRVVLGIRLIAVK